MIELLFIIVILAIIAGVTVPIVVNTIDKSRMSTAKISAVSFKDSINKFKLVSNIENLYF